MICRSNNFLKSVELLAPDDLLSCSCTVTCDQDLTLARLRAGHPIGALATSSMPEKCRFFIAETTKILRRSSTERGRGMVRRWKGTTRRRAVHESRWEVRPFSVAQDAICAREVNPSFEKILLICASTVRTPTTRVPAISRFDFPCAMSAATSRSRSVKPLNASLLRRRAERGPVRGIWERASWRKVAAKAVLGDLRQALQ